MSSPTPMRASTRPSTGTLTYARLDLRRQLRDKANLFFIVGLPVCLTLVFGTGGDEQVGSGNVALYVTISMAVYGAVTGTTAVSGTAAYEQQMGWGRQLALTPLRPVWFIALKAAIALSVAAVPIAMIYLVGGLTGAKGELGDWIGSAVIVWAGSIMFAIYGLAVCLVFRTPGAVSIASGALVVLSFLGNLFIPLAGTMLAVAKFTPLYGYAALARYPLTGGDLPDGAGHDPLWLLFTSVIAWTLVFTGIAVWGLTRSKDRG